MSPENQWLEDIFPTKIVPFLGDMLVFRGVNKINSVPLSGPLAHIGPIIAMTPRTLYQEAASLGHYAAQNHLSGSVG